MGVVCGAGLVALQQRLCRKSSLPQNTCSGGWRSLGVKSVYFEFFGPYHTNPYQVQDTLNIALRKDDETVWSMYFLRCFSVLRINVVSNSGSCTYMFVSHTKNSLAADIGLYLRLNDHRTRQPELQKLPIWSIPYSIT
jgi:hypothetical protein